MLLCRLVMGESISCPPAAESAVSNAFIQWYRRLITSDSQTTVTHVNKCLVTLAGALPSASRVIQAAMSEAAVS